MLKIEGVIEWLGCMAQPSSMVLCFKSCDGNKTRYDWSAMMFGLEFFYAMALYGTFFILWKGKQFLQRRKTGRDPEVMGDSSDALQRYFFLTTKVLSIFATALIFAHGAGLKDVWGFRRLAELDIFPWDHIGFAIGAFGLSICLLAQWTMGSSWRVGIDQRQTSALVTTGIFNFVRNPTYLGLFLLNGGLWLIWPTPTMALFGLVFAYFLEVQVRCEEQYLTDLHGEMYKDYMVRTKRYFPLVY